MARLRQRRFEGRSVRQPRCGLGIALATGALLISGLSPAAADPAPAPDSVRQLETLVAMLVQLAIPGRYENAKDWGAQKSVTRGLRLERDGLRLELRRRKKRVNHGVWTRYRIEVSDPAAMELDIRRLRVTEDGKFRFDLVAEAPLKEFARRSRWQRGVQLWSFSADAQGQVRFKADCEVDVRVVPAHVPPDIQFHPHIHAADVQLLDFELNHLSDVGGEVAEFLGKGLEKVIEKELADRRQDLPRKLNRQIARHSDKLCVSLHDVMQSKWKRLLGSD